MKSSQFNFRNNKSLTIKISFYVIRMKKIVLMTKISFEIKDIKLKTKYQNKGLYPNCSLHMAVSILI
jgi:hypothetical protein